MRGRLAFCCGGVGLGRWFGSEGRTYGEGWWRFGPCGLLLRSDKSGGIVGVKIELGGVKRCVLESWRSSLFWKTGHRGLVCRSITLVSSCSYLTIRTESLHRLAEADFCGSTRFWDNLALHSCTRTGTQGLISGFYTVENVFKIAKMPTCHTYDMSYFN